MPLFYLVLKSGRRTVPDPQGIDLADEGAARGHAVAVAKELMRNRENETRSWRIEVCDDYLQPLFEVLFATADDTIEHFRRDLQISIKHVARTAAALNDAVLQARRTLRETRDTLARAERILASLPPPGEPR